MPRPVLKRRGKPSNKPKMVKVGRAQGKTEVLTPKDVAAQAVAVYDGERELLEEMLSSFEENFPEAAKLLQHIKMQQDLVDDKIQEAKALVKQAKETVGDFLCTRKFSKPKYNDAKFTDLVGKSKDGQVVVDLIKEGHVKTIALKPSATGWFAQHGSVAKDYQDAWQEKLELPPAVTVPKI